AEFKVLGYSGDYYVKNVQTTKKPVTITLDKETATVAAGETLTLVATKENTENDVIWTSSDETVATVNADGVVTALGAGQTTITATVDGKEAKCVVTVTAFSIDNGQDITLIVGETHTIAVTANNTEEAVSFTSSAETVATVDSDGVVTALKEGETTITVKAGTVEKEVKVTVLEGTRYSGTSDVDALTYSGNAFSYHGVDLPTLVGGTTEGLESIEFDIYFTGDISGMYMEITCENTTAAGFIAGNRYYNYVAIATGSPTWQANSNGNETNGRYLYLSYNAGNGGNYSNYNEGLQYLIIEGIDVGNNLSSAMTSGKWYHVTYMFTRTDMDYTVAEFKVLGYSGDYYVKNVQA
ncbi:MAG: Ig domain-containing protein, partial [Candidatus Scatosoma sp.]